MRLHCFDGSGFRGDLPSFVKSLYRALWYKPEFARCGVLRKRLE